MKFYEYIHRDSFIHRLDPRAKMFWLVVFSALVFMTSNPAVVVSILVFTLLIAVAAKLPKVQFWHSTKVFIVFLPVAYVLLYIFLLGLSVEVIASGLGFTAKFLVLIFAAVIFTMTTSSRDMLLALTKMKVPYAFAFMLTIAIRFIPVITKEINSVIDAQRARAYEISFSIRHPVRSVEKFVPILIPVLMLLLKRSHELSLSIDSRAFRAKNKVTYGRRLKFKAGDWLFSILVSGILLAVIFI